MIIITNNPEVNKTFNVKFQVKYYPEASHLSVLTKARDLIHLGASLVISPMLGNIKPHETPYRTVVLNDGLGAAHVESILLIEESINITNKLLSNTAYIKYDESQLKDLSFIDRELIIEGIEKER